MSAATIAALVTAVSILITALVAFTKRKPDMARVIVTSAGELTIQWQGLADERRRELEAADERIRRMEARQNDQETELRASAQKIEALHRELATMHQTMVELTEANDRANEQLDASRNEVDRLRARVQLLEDTLRARDIPLPEGPPHDGLA